MSERAPAYNREVAENAHRIDGLREAIAELGNRMDRRFEALEQRHSRQFLWLTGTLAATMLAVVSILSAALLGG